MNTLKTLVMMQLNDRIDTSFLAKPKTIIFKVVLSIIKFVIYTGLIYLGFSVVELLKLVAILPGIPQNFFNVIFTVVLLLSTVVCTFGLMKTLYFSKDNQLLLTMPAGRTTVFVSKLIVYFIYECIRNVFFLLPLFYAYGLINGFPFYFYLWAILGTMVLTAFPVVLGSLFSIPLMFITNFVRQYKVLGYGLLLITTVIAIVFIVRLIDIIPENFDLLGTWGTTFWKVQDFLKHFNESFLFFGWLSVMVVGERYGISNALFTSKQFLVLLGFVMGMALVFGLVFLLVRPLYFRMTSSPFEYKKVKITKTFKNHQTNSFFSSIKKDIILYFRSPGRLFSLLAVVIGMPIAIFLLNKIYAAMDTRLSGAYMTIAFNIMIMLLIAMATNGPVAHIYSEEGGSSYLIRTSPQSHLKMLSAKLIISMVLTSISLLVSTIVFGSFSIFSTWEIIILYITLELVYLAHMFWSAEMDIMNPQTAQYKTTGGHVNNPNEIKSTVMSFLLAALFAFMSFFFIGESIERMPYRLLIFAALFFAIRIWLYINKIKVYYIEVPS